MTTPCFPAATPARWEADNLPQWHYLSKKKTIIDIQYIKNFPLFNEIEEAILSFHCKISSSGLFGQINHQILYFHD